MAALMPEWAPIEGVVRRGAGRGRKLGFPTANLDVGCPGPDLEAGVYVGRAQWDEAPTYGTVVNYGVRPTFAETEISLEIYVLDFSGDLYGKTLTLEVLGRLREEKRFADSEELQQQIAIDIERARQLLASMQPV